MKMAPRRLLILPLLFILYCGTVHASIDFTFSGSDKGGIGAAEMSFDLSNGTPTGNIVKVSIFNTSPTTLINGTGVNSPGITGFGFDFVPDLILANLESWSLVAKNNVGVDVTVGSSTCAGCDWVMGTFQAGVTFDFLPQVQTGMDGALYNPAATSGLPGGANSVYFTEAILTLDFNSGLAVTDVSAAYVRMQNVGKKGDGSLKLDGEREPPNGDPPNGEVPEPGSLALVALGIAGLGLRRRRQTRAR